MNTLLTFSLICFGITNIVVTSLLFAPVRDFLEAHSKFLGKLINCAMCFGFWTGIFVSTCGHLGYGVKVSNVFFDGCISSGVCWVMYLVCEILYGLYAILDQDKSDKQPENAGSI